MADFLFLQNNASVLSMVLMLMQNDNDCVFSDSNTITKSL